MDLNDFWFWSSENCFYLWAKNIYKETGSFSDLPLRHLTPTFYWRWFYSVNFSKWNVFLGKSKQRKKNGGLIPMIKFQSSLKYLKIMCKLNSTSGKTKSDPFSCWHGSFFRTLLLFAFFSAMREMVLKSIRLNTQWRYLNFCISAPKWACFTEMAWPDPVQKAIQLN